MKADNTSSHTLASVHVRNRIVHGLPRNPRVYVRAETMLEADGGYQGMARMHANSLLPKKLQTSPIVQVGTEREP